MSPPVFLVIVLVACLILIAYRSCLLLEIFAVLNRCTLLIFIYKKKISDLMWSLIFLKFISVGESCVFAIEVLKWINFKACNYLPNLCVIILQYSLLWFTWKILSAKLFFCFLSISEYASVSVFSCFFQKCFGFCYATIKYNTLFQFFNTITFLFFIILLTIILYYPSAIRNSACKKRIVTGFFLFVSLSSKICKLENRCKHISERAVIKREQ